MQSEILKPRRGRPPKISREQGDTRALLIRSGLEQLTQFGFASSGIEPILKKVGVPKGSFYHYFASKEAFGLAVLNEYDQYFQHKLKTHLKNTNLAPLGRINAFVDDAKSGMQKHQFKRGCLVGNLGQEIVSLPESFRVKINQIFNDWQHHIAECLLAAQQQGQIPNDSNCNHLAEVFWIGWEGAVSRAKLSQNCAPMDSFISHFIGSITT